jgi:hypothetical protein
MTKTGRKKSQNTMTKKIKKITKEMALISFEHFAKKNAKILKEMEKK